MVPRYAPLCLKVAHVCANRGHYACARFFARLASHTHSTLSALRAQVFLDILDTEGKPEPILSGAPDTRFDSYCTHARKVLTLIDNQMKSENNSELPREKVDAAFEALTLLFHPTFHQRYQVSPIVTNSQQFHAALWEHDFLLPLKYQARLETDSSKTTSQSTPTRILVLTDTNLAFMDSFIDSWRADPSIKLRVRNLAEEASTSRKNEETSSTTPLCDTTTPTVDPNWWSLRETLADRLNRRVPEVPPFLAQDLEWADTLYLEWGSALSARLSGINLNAHVVVRLHRYEAFTMMPTLTRWEGIDDLILISPAIREALIRSVPGIEKRTRISIIPNAIDLDAYALPKNPHCGRTIALIGYDRGVKDPLWALDVLEELLHEDSSWRLLLVGDPGPHDTDAYSREYFATFNQRVHDCGRHVVRLGYRHDIPEVLRDVSVILSSSTVEGDQLSLLQGAISGALPVVRNWPNIAPLGTPHALYPAQWIVDTPRQAARRISHAAHLAHNNPCGPAATEDARQSAAWVRAQYDPEHTLAKLHSICSPSHTTSCDVPPSMSKTSENPHAGEGTYHA